MFLGMRVIIEGRRARRLMRGTRRGRALLHFFFVALAEVVIFAAGL
jgi:hypothetical protein